MKKGKETKNNKNQDMAGFPDLLKMFISINKRGMIAVYLAIPTALILKRFFHINIPTGILIPLGIFAVTITIYLYLLTKKVKNTRQMEDISMAYFVANLLLYTAIIHYSGGIEWVGVFIYFFIIVEASIVLPKRRSLLITLAAIAFYSFLGVSEYFGVIPHHKFFISGTELYQNASYLAFVIIACAVAGFSYITFITNNYSSVFRKISNTLAKERERLVGVQVQLEESKATLEIKVEARTKELTELTDHLEEQVKQRTKQLQSKVQELEKFQKFAVGREIKMVELKKEISKLKKN